MLKKFITALLAIAIMFSPIGNTIIHDNQTVSAKRYSSGIKKFNQTNKTNTQYNKKQDTKSVNKTFYSSKSKKGGLMKGLLFGGLAGFLLGGLLSQLGALGSIIGLAVNIIAILLLLAIIRKIFTSIIKKRYREDRNQWR